MAQINLLISSFNKEPFNVQIAVQERLDTLLMIVCMSCKLTTAKIEVFHNKTNISSNLAASLESLGIADNDIIEITPKAQSTLQRPDLSSSSSSSTFGGGGGGFAAGGSGSGVADSGIFGFGGGAGNGSDLAGLFASLDDIPNGTPPERWLQIVEHNPNILLELRSGGDDVLADALVERDLAKLRLVFMKRYTQMHKKTYAKEMEMAEIAANPDSAENQAKMAEMIRAQNVQENMETAQEYYPETFGRVNMLYVQGEINGKPLKIFVDSGAQVTVISKNCAERCGLDRILDTRYSGEMRGVGVGRMLGKIHLAQIKLGGSFFPISLSVLETSDIDMLLGLDMLKRHRSVIDLTSNTLRMESGSGIEAIPFLGDAELPVDGEDSPSRKFAKANP